MTTSDGTPRALRQPPHPSTGERLYDDEEREFLAAIVSWRKAHGWRIPTNCQLLAIARGLGWRKVAEADAADAPDAPAEGV